MDKERKRLLKKLGKQEVKRRSDALHAGLQEANPYETDDPRWGEAYKLGTQRERWLSRKCPTLHRKRLHALFVVLPKEDDWVAYVSGYIQCLLCGSALSSITPKRLIFFTGCRCLNLFSWQFLIWGGFRVRQMDKVQGIKLLGRG